MYKLLVMDLDDTLLTEDLTIPATTIAKLTALGQRGVGVTLATGRMYPSARIYALQLGLTLPLITYNGAVVRTATADEAFFAHLLPLTPMRQVMACCKQHNWYLQIYNDDQIIVETITAETRLDPDMKNAPAVEVGNFLSADIKPSPKMMIVANPAHIDHIKETLRHAVADSLYMAGSKPYLLEIMPAQVSKANALAELTAKLGIERREVIAIGDSSNDLEMIKWAGLGVAVGNATAVIKEAADHITEACRNLAVEEIIERYFPA